MKFMAVHTLPPHSVTRDQAREIADAAQHDPLVHGCRSFMNLSEGKVVCIMEAPDQRTLANWYDKMHLPYDNICAVEFEGELGHLMDVQETSTTAVYEYD
jgi:hypothetical protein